MDAFWKGLQALLANQMVQGIITLWVTERFLAMRAERCAHDCKSAEAIDTQTTLGASAPRHAKNVMKASKEGQSVEFNSALDIVSPLLFGKKRVSKKAKIGRFLLKCLPIVSRFV